MNPEKLNEKELKNLIKISNVQRKMKVTVSEENENYRIRNTKNEKQ